MELLKRTMEKLHNRLSRKSMTMFAAIVVAISSLTGGTLAFLMDTTPAMTNTFVIGDINIDLTESDTGDMDGDPNTNTYLMMPGATIYKDPRVTVEAGSEDCWLYVQLTESDNFQQYLVYAMADGWTALEGQPGVYYRSVDKADVTQVFDVLQDNIVQMRHDVTKQMLLDLSYSDVASYPRLTISAYAVQRDESITAISSAQLAWEQVLAAP